MALPLVFAMMTPEPTSEQLLERKQFLELVEGMDLPKHRVLNHDYHWIWRNAGIRNKDHPNIKRLMIFLRPLVT